MDPEPQPTKPQTTYRSDGPFGALLNYIPLQSRFAVTAGVVVGVVASVIAGGIESSTGQIALGNGVGAGLMAAIVLAIRGGTNQRDL